MSSMLWGDLDIAALQKVGGVCFGCSGVEGRGVEWSGVEWSGVEWSGVFRGADGEVWRGCCG
jgi:hypothetical protein